MDTTKARFIVYKTIGAVDMPYGEPIEAQNALEALSIAIPKHRIIGGCYWLGSEFHVTLELPTGKRARFYATRERMPQP